MQLKSCVKTFCNDQLNSRIIFIVFRIMLTCVAQVNVRAQVKEIKNKFCIENINN